MKWQRARGASERERQRESAVKTTRKRAVRAPTGDVSLRGDGGVVQANGSSGDGSLGNGEHILCIMGVC